MRISTLCILYLCILCILLHQSSSLFCTYVILCAVLQSPLVKNLSRTCLLINYSALLYIEFGTNPGLRDWSEVVINRTVLSAPAILLCIGKNVFVDVKDLSWLIKNSLQIVQTFKGVFSRFDVPEPIE